MNPMEIERRRELAQAMLQRRGRGTGPAGAFSQILGTVAGMRGLRSADRDMQTYKDQKQERNRTALAEALNQYKAGNQEGAFQALSSVDDPKYIQLAQSFMKMNQPQSPDWSSTKSGINPETGRPGFFQVDSLSGDTRWLDGAMPEPKNGITVGPDGTIQIGGSGGAKLPGGYQWKDPRNPSAGVTPIKGGPVERQTPEAAAKTQMMESAIGSAKQFKGMIMPDGEVDRVIIGQMQANVPGTEGRQARVLIRDAIEAKLRAESGAAVPDTEVARASERFMPSVLDNDETIRTKMRLLEDFMSGAINKIDPEKGLPDQSTPAPETKPETSKSPADMTDEELRKALGIGNG